MSIKRTTISVPDEVATRIKKAAGGMPVSAWVTGIVEERLEDRELDRLWKEFYQTVRPQPSDVRRADAIFNKLAKARRRVLSSDAADLRAIDPTLHVEEI